MKYLVIIAKETKMRVCLRLGNICSHGCCLCFFYDYDKSLTTIKL